MCELFSVSSAKMIKLNEYLREFFSHSVDNPNGWGMAFLDDGNVSIEKEPQDASRSLYLKERLATRIEASDFFGHIRKATIGKTSYDNSHPFVRKDITGRRWAFMHNGTIFECPILSNYFYRQTGSTDSERILLYIIDEINSASGAMTSWDDNPAIENLTPEARFALIDRIICDISKGNKLNLIMSDGYMTYVHTNYRSSLHILQREGTAIFSTKPLSDEGWDALPMNTLLAYKNGRLLYTGTTHQNEYIDNPEDMKHIFVSYSEL